MFQAALWHLSSLINVSGIVDADGNFQRPFTPVFGATIGMHCLLKAFLSGLGGFSTLEALRELTSSARSILVGLHS